MEILNYNPSILKDIIIKTARYQKVMLLYDNSASSSALMDIYSSIREDCIFNKMSVAENLSEVYNGYKAIIYLGGADGFLHLGINLDEFVCIVVPQDVSLLPYFLNENCMVSCGKRYLLIQASNFDISPICSLVFNNYYNYLNDLVFKQFSNINFNFNFTQITQRKILESIINAPTDYLFYDIKLLKACKIPYRLLPILDYILMCAFNCMVECVHGNNLCLVDVYKAFNNNYELLDRYYAMINNGVVVHIMQLNFSMLSLVGKKTSQEILKFVERVSANEIEIILSKLKEYSKTSGDILNYLYLYNMFAV